MTPTTQTRPRSLRPRWSLASHALLALAPLAATTHALAQAASPGVVVAEQLFREGQTLLKASETDPSQTHPACEKFQESQRLRPALGTLLNLAVCHEREKKTASAWAEYTQVAGQASRAGQADRAQFAQQHAATLERNLFRLRLDMVAPPLNTEVRIDGQPVGAAVLGTDIPLDPGAHEIVVAAPGKQAWSHTVSLGPDHPNAREQVPTLADESHAATAEAKIERGPAGYIVGLVGAAACAAGGVFIGRGALYSSQGSDESTKAAAFTAAHDTTNAANYNAAANSDKSAGTTNIVIGAVAGGVGLAGIAIGIYLRLAGPSKEAPKPTAIRVLPDVGPGRAGGSLGFSF